MRQAVKHDKIRGKLARETLVICGSARLPKNAIGEGKQGLFSIELEVTQTDFRIVDVSSSMAKTSYLGEKMLYNALRGYLVEEGIENAIDQIERRFFSPRKRAIIAALEDTKRCYKRIINNSK